MPHRPRGAYIGGHTVIGPQSGWFSRSKPNKKAKRLKPLSPQEAARRREAEVKERWRAEEQRRQAKEGKRERQRKAEEDASAKRAANIAIRDSPEGKAKQEAKAVARRQQFEAKMAKIAIVKRPLALRRGQTKQTAAAQSARRALRAAVGGRSSISKPRKKNRIKIPPIKKGAAGPVIAEASTLPRSASEPVLSSPKRRGGQSHAGADNGIILFTAFGRFAAG
jgi:hypothetical protein